MKPTSLNMKKLGQIGCIGIASLLASCGGGEDTSSNTPPVSTTPTQPGTGGGTTPGTGGGTTPGTGGGTTPGTSPTYLYGYAQGYNNLAQSKVVLSYNGTIVYTTQTDSNGKYEIDKSKFEQALKDYKIPTTGMLEIVIEGGKDTKQQKDLGTSLGSIVSQDKISGNYVSVVGDIVKVILEGKVKSEVIGSDGGYDKQKVRNKVQRILDTVGFIDVNNDSKKDIDDLFLYNISGFQSSLEDVITSSQDADYPFSTDVKKREKIVTKLFGDHNFISLKKQETTVYLEPFFTQSNIEYSFNNVDWYTYTSSGVMVTGTEKQLYYKELYTDGTFSKLGNTILNPNGVDPEPIGTPGEEPDPEVEPIIEEKPDVNDYVPVFPDVEKYEKDLGALDAEINKIKLAIEDLKKQYDTLTAEQKTQLAQLESQLQYLINLFNSLQKLPQDMVRGDLTVDNKRTILDQEFVANTTNATIGALSIAPIQAFTADKTTIQNLKPKEGEQVSQEKIQKLQNIVDSLARIMEAKRVAYEAKYQEYLKKKAEYEEDQRLYKFYQAEYVKYKAEYDGYKNTVSNAGTISPIGLNVGVILNNQGLDKTITTITAKKSEYTAPRASDYTLDTTSNSRSHTGYYPMEPGYNLFGTSYKVYIKFGVSGNKKDFPADVYIKNNTNGRESDRIEVKNLTHARDLREYLEKIMTIEVILDYLKKMKTAEEKKDEADVLRFVYGLLKEVSQDMYKAEYEAYLAEKTKYDNTKTLHDGYNNRLQTLLGDIRKVDSEFERKKGIEEYLGNLGVTIGNVAKEAENKQQEVILLGGKKEELSKDLLTKIGVSMDKMFLQYVPGNYPLDTTTNKYPANSQLQYKNATNYTKNPYSIYVKYNRKGNNRDYPVLIWGEYLYDSTTQGPILITERLEARNKDEEKVIMNLMRQKMVERQEVFYAKYHFYIFQKIMEKTGVADPEQISYILQTFSNKSAEILTQVTGNSVNFGKGFMKGGLDTYDFSAEAIQNLPAALKNIGEATGKGYAEMFKNTEALINFGLANGYNNMFQSTKSQQVLNQYQNALELRGNEINNQFGIFLSEMNSIYRDVKYILDNFENVEDKDYWTGYLTGLVSGAASQGAILTFATKNGKAAFQTISKSSLVPVVNLIQKMKVASAIAKSHFKPINFSRLQVHYDELGLLNSTQVVRYLEHSYVLAQRHYIKSERALIHVLYGEWKEKGGLQAGLHSMSSVENLLKDGSIKIAFEETKDNWKEVNYSEYMKLSDKQKSKVAIQKPNGNESWLNAKKKSLFPGNWSHDEIAQALKLCEDDIENLLAKLPKKLPEEYSIGTQWRQIKLNGSNEIGDITKTVTVNGKTITVRLGGKYDNNRNLDTTIQTFYP